MARAEWFPIDTVRFRYIIICSQPNDHQQLWTIFEIICVILLPGLAVTEVECHSAV